MALSNAERQARYRERHPERAAASNRAQSKKFHATHRDKAVAAMRARYRKNREQIRARVKAQRLLLNKDEESARRKALWELHKARWNARRREQRAANPESARRKQRDWRAANLELARRKEAKHRARPEQRAKAVARTAAWMRTHPEHARALGRAEDAKRRARKNDAFVETVHPWVVFKRDKGICGICHQSVDITSRWEIDHIVPIAKRGLHAYANVQLAHMRCNRRKGHRESVSVSRDLYATGRGDANPW